MYKGYQQLQASLFITDQFSIILAKLYRKKH